MTRDEIIRMARDAGFTPSRDEWVFGEMLERLARAAYAAGAAAEREACARIVDDAQPGGIIAAVAAAIRARGQK